NHDDGRPELSLNKCSFADDQRPGGVDIAFGSAVEYHCAAEGTLTVQLGPFGDDRRRGVRRDGFATLPAHGWLAEASSAPESPVHPKPRSFRDEGRPTVPRAGCACRPDMPGR